MTSTPAHVLIAVSFTLSVAVGMLLGEDDLHSSSADYPLTLMCDAPTIVGGTTTFVATLNTVGAEDTDVVYSSDEQYMYLWKDSRWAGFPVPVISNTTCTYAMTYNSEDDIGPHAMSVEVFYLNKIVKLSITFEVIDYIPAEVISTQNGTVCSKYKCNAATNQSVFLTVDIHDPSGYLEGSSYLFDWDFGDGEQLRKSTMTSVSHTYMAIGDYRVGVAITAINSIGHIMTGSAYRIILALDAIQNLTVDGVDNVMVGEEKKINVSCHGSPPVSFCWIVSENLTSNATTTTDERCLQSYLLEECRLAIDYQFNESKQYSLSIRASNDVGFERLVLNVDPKSPPDLKPEGIAGAVLAILIGIVLTVYSVSIITRQVQKSRRRHIEVANFNFEASSSYEHIREHAKQLNNRAANEKTPLLLDRNIPLDVRWDHGNNDVLNV